VVKKILVEGEGYVQPPMMVPLFMVEAEPRPTFKGMACAGNPQHITLTFHD